MILNLNKLKEFLIKRNASHDTIKFVDELDILSNVGLIANGINVEKTPDSGQVSHTYTVTFNFSVSDSVLDMVKHLYKKSEISYNQPSQFMPKSPHLFGLIEHKEWEPNAITALQEDWKKMVLENAYTTPVLPTPVPNILSDLIKFFPNIRETVSYCPATEPECMGDDAPIIITLDTMIMHLNDFHKWAREDIADWLETLDIDLTIQEKEMEDGLLNSE